jgi:hypothetical protein
MTLLGVWWCRSILAGLVEDACRRLIEYRRRTGDDHAEVPVGTGWWDVTPDQVGSATGKTSLDIASLATC